MISMKKILLAILCFCICLGICACSEQSYINNETIEKPSSSTTSSIVEESNIWSVRFYRDEFNQETNEWCVLNEDLFHGQFSNSATTNSTLSVRVFVDGKKVVMDGKECTIFSFILYEYGSHQVKNAFSKAERYVVQLRDEHGNEYSGYGSIAANGDRIVLNADTADKALQFMKSSDKISVYIKEKEGMSSYLFSITTDNFFDRYE